MTLRGLEVSRRFELPGIEISCTWSWWGCQSYSPSFFTQQELFLVLISVRIQVLLTATLRLKESCQLKLSIALATFRFAWQCFDQLHHLLPQILYLADYCDNGHHGNLKLNTASISALQFSVCSSFASLPIKASKSSQWNAGVSLSHSVCSTTHLI
jgi:hypothetical protein